MNTKGVGDISEAYAAARLLELGYPTMKPLGDNQRYDLVIDRGDGFERVQVKTGRSNGDRISFYTASSYSHRGRPRRDYRDDADLFAVYCPETRGVYLIPVEIAPRAEMYLRLTPPKNGQTKGVHLASQYAI